MTYNSDKFSLQNWKLTLPIDKNGSYVGEAVEIKDLKGFQSPYFYNGADGAMVFLADAGGSTTSGSAFPRSELREMLGGAKAGWTLSEGGIMSATLKVDAAPTLSDGTTGRVIVGQIHGQDEELLRLYWDKNTVYFMNDRAGPNNKELKFTFADVNGLSPQISLGEKFSYKIDAHGDTLRADIFADGHIYSSVSKINAVWQSDILYFKTGIYLGVNEDTGQGAGQDSFYGLDFGHTTGAGLGGWNTDVPPPPPPLPDPGPSSSGTEGMDSIAGTNGDDTLHGKGDNDILHGMQGNDFLYGDSGNDALYGDAGDDRLEGGAGDDSATGGLGRDVFIVNHGDEGLLIADFDGGRNGDQLLLKGYSSDELLKSSLIATGSDCVLSLPDGARIIFHDITLSEFSDVSLKADINGNSVAFHPQGVVPDPSPGPLPGETKTGTDGADKLFGSDHQDDVILGKGGDDVLNGQDGDDKLYGQDGNDTLWGNDNNDLLVGGNGDDKLYGQDDKDVLFGGDGNDKLFGGDGDDVLHGGAGQNYLHGGGGKDVFVFEEFPSGHDILADFDATQDKLDLEALLGPSGTAAIKIEDGHQGLYVDADGSGPNSPVLIATFEHQIQIHDIKDILLK